LNIKKLKKNIWIKLKKIKNKTKNNKEDKAPLRRHNLGNSTDF
jgi:hypothetical protein